VRFVFIDTRYDQSIEQWYEKHPGLGNRTSEEQRDSYRSSLIGETHAQVAALRARGHEAMDIIFNLLPAQAAWANEHGLPLSIEPRWGLRLRRGLVPWPVQHRDLRWTADVLLSQIEHFRPDVIHLSAMNTLDPALILEVRKRCRFMVGQTASLLSTDRALLGYDLVVSSLPNFVDRFREAGVDAEWLPLAFDPSVLVAMGPMERDIGVSFVGSLFDVHMERARVIAALQERCEIDIWSEDAARLNPGRDHETRTHRGVWGAEMYRVLRRSTQTVNVHGRTEDIPPVDANNMRLFEATGMGALLVTDRLRTLGELFDVGREVVDYGSPEEAVEVVSHFSDHPDEASSIAVAGQARTLRDHTWANRMDREVAMIEQRI
jgi:hypothetical protein